MGLALAVGMLADLIVNDEEGADWFRENLVKLNDVLNSTGLSAHAEPTESATYSAGTYGYSGIHHLRRCAAHLQYNGTLPPPLAPNEKATLDAHYTRYGEDFERENETAVEGAFARPSQRRFDHLIMHSDAEGFYVPQDFDRVIIAGDMSFGWVGSSHALRRECEQLAVALEIPPDLLADYESQLFERAIEDVRVSKPAGWGLFKPRPAARALWEQHPVAAMLCAKLHGLAGHSIQTGALLVFC